MPARKRVAVTVFMLLFLVSEAAVTFYLAPIGASYHQASSGYDPALFRWLNTNVPRAQVTGVLSNDYVAEWLSEYQGYDVWSYPPNIYLAPGSYFTQSEAVGNFAGNYYSFRTANSNLSIASGQEGWSESFATIEEEATISPGYVTFVSPSGFSAENVSDFAPSSANSSLTGSLIMGFHSVHALYSLEIIPNSSIGIVSETVILSPAQNTSLDQYALTVRYSGYTIDPDTGGIALVGTNSSIAIRSPVFAYVPSNGSLLFVAEPSGPAGTIAVNITISSASAPEAGNTSLYLPSFATTEGISYVICSQPYCSTLSQDQSAFGFPVQVYQDAQYQVYSTGRGP